MRIITTITVVLMLSHMLFGGWGYKLGFGDAQLKLNLNYREHQKLLQSNLNKCNKDRQIIKEDKEKYEFLFHNCSILLKGH